MIKMENNMLSVMVEKTLVETYNYNKCDIYEVKIKNLNKYYIVLF